MPRYCRHCQDHDKDHERLDYTLNSYVSSMDSDLKAEPNLYQNRLAACDECDKNHHGMCRLCGCYVKVRAAKKALHCPDYNQPKW